jgi:thiamine-monophosphate kinase
VTPPGEFERIGDMLEVAAGLPTPPELRIGPGDDAAVLEPAAGESMVVSIDLSLEGVHFRREWLTWEAIGYRATAAALSDLAAMAARPVGALVSVALPIELDTVVYQQLAHGITEALAEGEAALLGGDTSRSPGPAVVDVTVIGAVTEPVTRAGARPGDHVWVTGRLGGAAAAVLAYNSALEPSPSARRRFERPRPRWREARWLAERGVLGGLIDLSDGLAGDAAHIARASDVGLRLRVDRLPLDEALEGWSDTNVARRIAAGGGEDYELLFTSPAGRVDRVREAFQQAFDLELTRIGDVVEETDLPASGVRWIDRAGEPVDPPATAGFDHFAG